MSNGSKMAVIYARYSPRPAGKAPSETIETQIERCRAWCEAKDLEIYSIHTDEMVSGSGKQERPGFMAAVDKAMECKGNFVVYNLSRFGRNLELTLKWQKKLASAGVELSSVKESIDTSNASGRLLFAIQGAMAEYYRDQLSETTSDTMQAMMKAGKKVSAIPPYGFKYEGNRMVYDDLEQIIMKRICELKEQGMPLRKIAETLNDYGYATRNNSEWTYQKVAMVLKASKRGITLE